MIKKRLFTIMAVLVFSILFTGVTLGAAKNTHELVSIAKDKPNQFIMTNPTSDSKPNQVSEQSPAPQATLQPKSAIFPAMQSPPYSPVRRTIPPTYLPHHDSLFISEGEIIEASVLARKTGYTLFTPNASTNIQLGPSAPELTPPIPGNADLVVCLSTARTWGIGDPYSTFTVSVNADQMGAAQSDQIGFFFANLMDSSGEKPPLIEDDLVVIYQEGSEMASTSLRSISGAIDVVNNLVTGTIGGSGFPISVTVYAPGWEPNQTLYSMTVSSDNAGDFMADFDGVYDFIAWDEAIVAVVENDIEIHQHVYPQQALLVRASPLGFAIGYATPNAPITVTLYASDGTTIKETSSMDTNHNGMFISMIESDIEENDIVQVELSEGVVLSRTVDRLTMEINSDNDIITGESLPGSVVRGMLDSSLTPIGRKAFMTETTADASGYYTLNFSSQADILPGDTAAVFVANDQGVDLNPRWFAPSVGVNQVHDSIWGYGAAPFGEAGDAPITLTLYSAETDSQSIFNKNLNTPYGHYEFSTDDGLPNLAPGDVITVQTAYQNWQGVVSVLTLTAQADLSMNQIIGTSDEPSDRVEFYGEYYNPGNFPLNGSSDTYDLIDSGNYTISLPAFDIRNNFSYDISHRTGNDYINGISRSTGGFGALLPFHAILGNLIDADLSYTITLTSQGNQPKGTLTGQTVNAYGDIGWNSLSDIGLQLEPGDQIQIQSDHGFSQTLIIPETTIAVDPETFLVSGITNPNERMAVYVENQSNGWVSSLPDGSFTFKAGELFNVFGNGELEWGNDIWVETNDQNWNWVAQSYFWPRIVAQYDGGGFSEVWGDNAFPGESVDITITHPVSGVIHTATVNPGECQDCSQTQYRLPLQDNMIQPGITVTADFGLGFIDQMTVVELSADAYVDTDLVVGTAPPDSNIYLNVDCVYGGCWTEMFDIPVDSSGVFTADLGSQGYDILPGDNFNIHYTGYHDHETQYSFQIPYPEIEVSKWSVSGHAHPAGHYVYGVYFDNSGTAEASNITLVDHLPLSTTWAGDTSGVTPSIDPSGVITWNLGNLSPGEQSVFMVTLNVSEDVPTGTGSLEANCLDIYTQSFGDPNVGNNSSCSSPVDVWEDDAGININKWSNPGDPAPGEEFTYEIQWCSDRGAATGATWLTDTLPISTTLVGWEFENWWEAFWQEIMATDEQLVLYAPGLPGNYCQVIRVRLRLDDEVLINTPLQNSVVITTNGDVDPQNNQVVNTDARSSLPRYDFNANLWFNNGVLAPGGWINYGANFWNAGNSSANSWISSTLPAGTTYQPGSGRKHNGEVFEPDIITSDTLIWYLGDIEVMTGFGFDFAVEINPTVSAGSTLSNCTTVAINQLETTPWDNASCVALLVNDHGRNLSVEKSHSWQGNDDRLQYEITIRNTGEQGFQNVTFTDTYPLSTTLAGSPWWDYWSGVNWSDDSDNQHLVFELEFLNPGDTTRFWFDLDLTHPENRPAWYTNTVEVMKPPDDVKPEDNTFSDIAGIGVIERFELWVGSENSSLWGEAQPGATLTVTTPVSEVTAFANPDCNGCWDIPECGPIYPGDQLEIANSVNPEIQTITIPEPFSVSISSASDMVWGEIAGSAGNYIEIHGYWPGGYHSIPSGSSGIFNVTDMNVPRGANGHIRYPHREGLTEVIYHLHMQADDLILMVNSLSSEVTVENYPPGQTGFFTLTNNIGNIKATAEVTSGDFPWGGQGFYVKQEDWSSPGIQIVSGDWVYGSTSENLSTQVRIGTISGAVNVNEDKLSGQVDVPWFTNMLDIDCHPWGGPPGTPSKQSYAGPDGTPGYSCQWNPDTEWDITPGQDVGVFYIGEDKNWVGYGFREPAPYLRVIKYSYGTPGEGGNLTFRLDYANNGDGDAENVTITDTLQGMTYLADTSGVITQSGTLPGGDQFISFDLGTIPANTSGNFEVYVQVDESPSNTLTNTAQIATSNPYDQGDIEEKLSTWNGHVEENNTHLNVGLGVWTGDPAPGYKFVWAVNICNNGSTDSAQLWLTDTLPISTTLLNWWGQHPGWQEVTNNSHQLVLTRPSLSAGWCSEVYLKLNLDSNAYQGMEITNQAVISSSNDLEDTDNSTTQTLGVGSPHVNLDTQKIWNGGQLVPGGEIRYNIYYHNSGNIPVTDTFYITDSLPISTSFKQSIEFDGGPEVSPIFSDSQIVVWKVDSLENGYTGGFEIILEVDSNASPGTILTNTIQVSQLVGEDTYDDNIAQWVEILQDHGPNLRVLKNGWWDNWGEDTRRATYKLRAENIGDIEITDILITDTYDSKLTLDGGVGSNYDRAWNWNHLPDSHAITISLEALSPGQAYEFTIGVLTDTSPLPFGLHISNHAEIREVDDETNTVDNQTTHWLTSGPDLYIEKTLLGGDLLPGEIITFSLTFGNNREGYEWWWATHHNVWVTDTLPIEMQFITASQRSLDWSTVTPDSIVGNAYTWNIGSLCAGCNDEIRVIARVSNTSGGYDSLINQASILSEVPEVDLEPEYDNNQDTHTFELSGPNLHVSKTYQGNGIAGTPITYTLWVSNSGNTSATGLNLTDQLPSNLTYGGGGYFNNGFITWTIPSLPPDGGLASRWFSGTLSCTTGVSVANNNYRIDSSDQSVLSENGPAVNFLITEPFIQTGLHSSASEILIQDSLYFTATSSTDGLPLVYQWDFGTGSAIQGGLTISHTYTTIGDYNVVFTATDSCGFQNSSILSIKVNPYQLFLPVVMRNSGS